MMSTSTTPSLRVLALSALFLPLLLLTIAPAKVTSTPHVSSSSSHLAMMLSATTPTANHLTASSSWGGGGGNSISSTGARGRRGFAAAARRRSRRNGWAAVLPRVDQPSPAAYGAGSLRCICAIPPLGISTLGWDAGMGVTCVAASVVWVKLCTGLANRGIVKPQVSRKLVHATAAPLFMLLWPFFSTDPNARFFAAGVPLAQAIRLTSAGLSGDRKNEDSSESELVKGISRSGRASEALGGPLKYALALMALTAVEWRTSVVGVVAILQMAVGDGLADLVGRRFGRHKWKKGGEKSLEGTAAFAVSAFASSMALIGWFHTFGVLAVSPMAAATRVAGISVACAAVELAPANVAGDDNINVPVTAMVLGRLLFAPGSPLSGR